MLIAGIADAQAVAACRTLNEGDTLTVTIGGTLDPASASVTVTSVFKRRGVVYSWPGNIPFESVLLGTDGVDVLITEQRTPIVHAMVFEEFKITPADYRVVVVKLGYLWPELYDLAKEFRMLLTKGSTCEVMTDCDFRVVPRPIYPLDRDMQWSPYVAP